MSVGYTWVQWSRHKRVYDAVVAGAAIAYVIGFVAVSKVLWRGVEAISDEIVVMRALGSCAFLLLTIILCIGPMARMERRVLPIMYNRRHLGVMTFLLALVHGAVGVGYYHGFGVLNPLVSLLATNTNYGSLRAFPFQTLGLVALAILFLMAATSHDFWLKNLSVSVWKGLHMLVYPAYLLLVGHVGLGALQTERGTTGVIGVGVCVALVVTLHLVAGVREARVDRRGVGERDSGGSGADGVREGGADRGVQEPGEDQRGDERVCASGRAAGGGKDHRWVRDVPVAWVAVSGAGRALTAAV